MYVCSIQRTVTAEWVALIRNGKGVGLDGRALVWLPAGHCCAIVLNKVYIALCLYCHQAVYFRTGKNVVN